MSGRHPDRKFLGRHASFWSVRFAVVIVALVSATFGGNQPFAGGFTQDPPVPGSEGTIPPHEGPSPTPASEAVVPDLKNANKPKPKPDKEKDKAKAKRPQVSVDYKGDGFHPALDQDKEKTKDPAVKKAKADGDETKTEESAGGPPIPKSLDPEVIPAENGTEAEAEADTGTGPIPTAEEPKAGTATPQPIPGDAKSFILPSDRIPMGRQSLGLTVDVISPEFWNINQTCALKIVIKNDGAADAMGVSVRDELPEGLTFVSSVPEAQSVGSLLTWSLGVVPANSERVITLNVKPTKTGAFDHAATVTMLAGGKSRTIVREPKLKVEQTATTGKILRGQLAKFNIVISNPGDGPARDVFIRAKLSSGLKHESAAVDQILEQQLKVIPAGGRVVLNTLEAETLLGGEQSCEVSAESADVVAGSPDARNKASVTVIEPKLTMELVGPDKRFTDMLATYELTINNPGSSPAKNVVVQVMLPVGGRLYATPPGAKFVQQGRKLVWNKSQLDPGEKGSLTFKLQMKDIGLYQVAAEAKGEGNLLAKATMQTDVSGLADVDIIVTEGRRAVDVGETTVYTIKIVNRGTKEATKLLVSAKIPETVEPKMTSGTDEQGRFDLTERTFIFPQIDRLGPGKQIELGIKVEATKPGDAVCKVFLTHDDLVEKLEDLAVFKVEKARR